jgi:hypothetical protein
MRIVPILMLVSLSCGAQTLSSPRKLESGTDDAALTAKVKASMKQYLEDMTERDLFVKETITQWGPTGEVLKVEHHDRKSKGTSLKKRDGALSPSFRTQANMGFLFTPGPLFFFEMSHDAAAMPIAVMLTAPDLDHYAVEGSVEGDRLRLHYQSQDKCVSFTASRQHLHVEYCGTGEITFDSAGVPLKATFVSSKVPLDVKNGAWIVKSWKSEETFQTVALPDTSTTLILPLYLKSTYETDKGNIVVENSYALARKK